VIAVGALAGSIILTRRTVAVSAAAMTLGAGSLGAVGIGTIVAHSSGDLGLVVIAVTGIVGAAVGASSLGGVGPARLRR